MRTANTRSAVDLDDRIDIDSGRQSIEEAGYYRRRGSALLSFWKDPAVLLESQGFLLGTVFVLMAIELILCASAYAQQVSDEAVRFWNWPLAIAAAFVAIVRSWKAWG
ncbi:MAG: hypothetical protein KBD16_00380 [Candidatus Pacebacteria bacterium]|nr:hypothetical protein [Candidatus Paceibacterota bacterium]